MSYRLENIPRRLAHFGMAAAMMATMGVSVRPSAATAGPRTAETAAATKPSARVAAAAAAKARAARAAKLRAARNVRLNAAARARGLRIVAFAKAQKGKPYRMGSRGPRAFDCSGLTSYTYRKAKLKLPRTADSQYHKVRRISGKSVRPGDLVFWQRGGRAYHVGVYAGKGKVWHAPKPGDRVKLAKIFDRGRVKFGRVGR
ncbi:C40 family peptidase [Actinoplanes sp. NPDC049668]|uniref:C40 family peptidase n=1 Tax=unclassified Actinoplanes TaxID=2626549 RepID=UPI0033A01776